MSLRGLSAVLALALILAAAAEASALAPGPAEARLAAAAGDTGWLSLAEERPSRGWLEWKRSARRVPSPVKLFITGLRPPAAFLDYAAGVDRRPAFHCRRPAPRSASENPSPH